MAAEPALHRADLGLLGGGDAFGESPDLGRAGPGGDEFRQLQRLCVVLDHHLHVPDVGRVGSVHPGLLDGLRGGERPCGFARFPGRHDRTGLVGTGLRAASTAAVVAAGRGEHGRHDGRAEGESAEPQGLTTNQQSDLR